MGKVRIDADTLHRLVDDGVSQAEIARHFGVSESAVSQRLKKLQILTSRVAALEKAGAVLDEKLSAVQRLENVQGIIDRELAWAVEQATQPGADRTALADVILKFAAGTERFFFKEAPSPRVVRSPSREARIENRLR